MRWRPAVMGLAAVVLTSTAGCTSVPPPVDPPASPNPAGLARRAAHTATELLDGTVVVAGGCDRDGCSAATASTMVVAPAGPRTVGGLNEPRDAHTATRLRDGSVLAVGGFGGEGVPPLTTAERYDPASSRWFGAGSMTLGRGGHAAALLGDGRVVVVGGWIAPQRYTATIEIYDPGSREFTAGPALPAAADGLAASPIADGSVLVTGGQVSPGVATSAAVVIHPDGTSTRVGPMAHPRFKHAMVALPSGRILVIGGTADDRALLTSTEVYDPVTQRFTAGPDLLAGRYKLAGSAARLPDGRVVVGGGGPGLELIDPVAGISTALGPAAGQRGSFCTVSVVGNSLRVIGGYDEQIALTGIDLTIPLADLPR